MKYTNHRDSIRSGDILCFAHEGWSSWKDFKIQLVRIATRSEYSHVGVAWVVGSRVFCIEATVPYVRIYPLSRLGNFYHIPMNAPWKPETEEKALSFVGNKYSQWKAFKAFFQPLDKGDTSECAALVIAIMDSDGISLGTRSTPDSVVLEAQKEHPTYYIENP